jgi:uncharacterized protein (DUF427 family)
VKIPSKDHPITIERNPSRVVITVAGKVIVDTRDALTLREAHYPAVVYVPRKDIDMTLLERTDHATYCPYKGDCAYFSRRARGQRRLDLREPVRSPRTDPQSPRVQSGPPPAAPPGSGLLPEIGAVQ